ncbi:MAG TPA: hypothetical protein VNI52_07170 [Sphingobacteriaceae bacterium]|nr:hypothetical protein [Sphingobacteriaceae bacterium]
MNNLKLSTFLVPGIALFLVVVFYFYLKMKAPHKKAFEKFTFIVLIIAFLFNLAWEVAQLPIYQDYAYNFEHIAFCALASVADAIMVLLLYYSFSLIYRTSLWVKNLTRQRIILLILVGGVGAILGEIRYTSEGNWAYANVMPIIPVVNAGLSPVLQFMILPILIYYLGFQILKKTGTNR